MGRPRILHVFNSPRVGGTENWILDFVAASGELVENFVVPASDLGTLREQFRDSGCYLPPLSSHRFGRYGAIARLRSTIRAVQPDQVWLHSDLARLYGSYLPSAPVRMIAVCHSPWGLENVKQHLRPWRLSKGWKGLLVVNDSLLEQGLSIEPAVPIATLVPPWRLASSLATLRNGRTVASLIYVARLVPGKGHDVLLDCFSQFRRREPSARLTFVGDGPLRARIETRIAELRLDEFVDLVGDVPSVAPYLQLHSVFVFPSESEGLARSGLEAALAGLPIVAFDLPAHDRYLQEGVNGSRSSVMTPAGLLRSLNYVFDNLDHFTAGAKRRSVELQDSMAGEFEQALRGVLQW